MTDRKRIPYLIYEILERELVLEEAGLTPEETTVQSSENPPANVANRFTVDQLVKDKKYELLDVSRHIYEALQVTLEFMDKGVKGLLSGDLSPYLLVEMQGSFDKYYKELEKLSN
jgi:hypothetical protein